MKHGTRTTYVKDKCRCEECTEANRVYNRERQRKYKDKTHEYGKRARKKRRELLDGIKLQSGCVECGFNGYPEALDFHHVGEKDMAIGSNRCQSLEKLLAELEKCIVLCANCHRIEHFGRGE